MANNSDWVTLHEGRLIKEARVGKKETQEKLAEYMGVDERTIRNWESGLSSLDMRQRRMLVTHYSLLTQQFGLSEQTDFTLETAEQELRKAKAALDDGAFASAFSIGEILVSNLARQVKDGEGHLLSTLACANYFAGHATSITENSPKQALKFFQNMEQIACELADDNWLLLAVTYQAEMYRRLGDYNKAISILTSVPHGTNIDILIRGNWAQLLGRAYAKAGQRKEMDNILNLAEDLALSNEERTSDIYVCYNIFSVLEERARLCMYSAPMKSLNYIERAKENIPSASRWRIPLLLTKGETLLSLGMKSEVNEPRFVVRQPQYEEGIKLIQEAVGLAQSFGHKRQLWRASCLPQHFRHDQDKNGYVARDLEDRFRRLDIFGTGRNY